MDSICLLAPNCKGTVNILIFALCVSQRTHAKTDHIIGLDLKVVD